MTALQDRFFVGLVKPKTLLMLVGALSHLVPLQAFAIGAIVINLDAPKNIRGMSYTKMDQRSIAPSPSLANGTQQLGNLVPRKYKYEPRNTTQKTP